MSAERGRLRPAHLASVVILALGLALTAAAAIAIARTDLSCLDFCVGIPTNSGARRALHVFGAPVTFSALAAMTLTVGLVAAVRSDLRSALSLSGRSWAALLSAGGPVRTPFEWIRLWIATAVISGVLTLACLFVSLIVGFTGDLSRETGSSPFGEATANAVLTLVAMVALFALLLGVFSLMCLAIGVIGFGVRSGQQSERRDRSAQA